MSGRIHIRVDTCRVVRKKIAMNRPREGDCDGRSSFTLIFTRELGMDIYIALWTVTRNRQSINILTNLWLLALEHLIQHEYSKNMVYCVSANKSRPV